MFGFKNSFGEKIIVLRKEYGKLTSFSGNRTSEVWKPDLFDDLLLEYLEDLFQLAEESLFV